MQDQKENRNWTIVIGYHNDRTRDTFFSNQVVIHIFNLLLIILIAFYLKSLILCINERVNFKNAVRKYYWSTVVVAAILNSMWFGCHVFLNLNINRFMENIDVSLILIIPLVLVASYTNY